MIGLTSEITDKVSFSRRDHHIHPNRDRLVSAAQQNNKNFDKASYVLGDLWTIEICDTIKSGAANS